jgi:Fic family protein
LYLEISGEKIIRPEELGAKKNILYQKAAKHKNIVTEILANPDIRDQFILKLTYHSNRIEGSTLTEPDTAAILFDNAALPDKSLTEQLEAKNHQTALNFLFAYISDKKKIDVALILRLHGILMNGVRPDAGMYRRHAVRIVGVNLPTANYLRVPDLLPAVLMLAAKKNEDILDLTARVHSRFEQIHPFSDGNGRVGRLLMNAMLLQANLAPAIIREGRKRLYYNYLFKAQSREDYRPLTSFLIDAISEGLEILERRDKN